MANTNNKNKTKYIKCKKCSRELAENNYYNTNSVLSTTGKLDICKKCLQDMIDLNNMNSVYKVLQLIDKPFLYGYWQKACTSKPSNPWGAYITMANSGLNEFKGATYNDSDFTGEKNKSEITIKNSDNEVENNEDYEYKNNKTYDKFWRGKYSQEELEYLNDYMKRLKTEFKIVTVNHQDYARKIALASLAVDKAYEGMLSGETGSEKRYNDLQKTFDTLSKSAQFSENSRGANDVTLGCFGVIFDKVEQHNWIPNHVPLEKDEYDKLIEYFSTINKSV